MKICVVGLGYIGLPTAAMFASHNCEVVGVDVGAISSRYFKIKVRFI